MFLKIKGIQHEITEENGIKVYKCHYCGCPCHRRIPMKESHKHDGIPKYILHHNKIKNTEFFDNPNIFLEETIIENDIKVYKNHFCDCPCHKRIPWMKYHSWYGIPKIISGHNKTFLGKQHPPEVKKKISDSLNKFWKEHPEIKKKRSIEYKKYLYEHPETILRMRNAKLGKPLSDKHRENISKAGSGSNNSNYGKVPSKNVGNGKRCYYDSLFQGRICFRSTYEFEYAKYLDNENILWEYEVKTFLLSDDTTYTPDFYLIKNNQYIEIKGFMTQKAQKKIDLFKQEYNKELKILYRNDLIKKGIKIK